MPIIPTKENPYPYGDGSFIPKSTGKEGPSWYDRLLDWYTNDFNPVKPSQGWIDAVQEVNNANVTGRQVRPRKGKDEKRVKPVPGAVDAETGKVTPLKPEPPADPSPTRRDVDRGGAKGTQTSPSPVKFDGTDGMDAFIKRLQGAPYGITFGGQGSRSAMESTSLPNTSSGKTVSITNGRNAGKYVNVNNPNFDQIVRGETEGGFIGEQISGSSNDSGLTAALADTEGMRSYMKRISEAEAPKGDDGYGPGYATDGLDARSRAFLDYDGPGGSLMALRAADAAQKTVYAGGKLYDVSGKNDDGKYNVVNDESRKFLRQNRNKTTASQEFKDAYQKSIIVPEDAASPDSQQPVLASQRDYMQLAERDMEGTLVKGPEDKIEPFENNFNRSFITGSPDQDKYNFNESLLVDPQEPQTRGFLPDEDLAEEIKRIYLQ